MAIHQDLAALSAEALDEYFTLAEIGLKQVKTDDGCLGYPSTLLVFCAIDALSNHLGYPEHSFLALNDPIIGLNLTEPQRTRLKRWYRHLLAHNGMIAPGTVLTPEESGRPIEFSASGEPTKIRVKVLFQIVKRAWDSFDRAKLRPRSVSLPTQQIDFSQASIAFPVASSGCNVNRRSSKCEGRCQRRRQRRLSESAPATWIVPKLLRRIRTLPSNSKFGAESPGTAKK